MKKLLAVIVSAVALNCSGFESTSPCFDEITTKYYVTDAAAGGACVYSTGVTTTTPSITAFDCTGDAHDVWIHAYGYVLSQNGTTSSTPVYFGDLRFYNTAKVSHTFSFAGCGWYKEVRVFITTYAPGTMHLDSPTVIGSNWMRFRIKTPPTQ